MVIVIIILLPLSIYCSMKDRKFPENKQSINNVKPNINFPRTKAQHELLSLHLAQEKSLTASLG